MWDLITGIERISLSLVILALIIYLLSVRKVTAFAIIVSSSIVLDFIQQWIRFELKNLFHLTDYLFQINAAWYLGFALTNTIFIVLMIQVFKRVNLLRDTASEFLIICYMFMTALQVFRFLDRIVFDTDLIGFIYKCSITTTNVVVAIVVLLYSFQAALKVTFKK
jgi:hypothetical protein